MILLWKYLDKQRHRSEITKVSLKIQRQDFSTGKFMIPDFKLLLIPKRVDINPRDFRVYVKIRGQIQYRDQVTDAY